MLKRFILILSVVIVFCSLAIAQEEPRKENEESKETKEAVIDQSTEVAEDMKSEVPWNKLCPVQGNPIEDDTPTVEYNGKTYGFCCPGCDIKFASKPEKYSKNLSEDGTRYIGR